MINLLTFLDGATYGSIWATGPIFVSCLLLEEDGSDVASILGRPTLSDQALNLTTTLFLPILSPNSTHADGAKDIWKSIPVQMSFVMVAYLAGHALGSYVGGKSQILHCMQRLCPKRMRSMPSNRVLSLVSSLLVSLLIVNWGFGIATYSGLSLIHI